MITLKNYKDHKPKRISFEGVSHGWPMKCGNYRKMRGRKSKNERYMADEMVRTTNND